MLTVQKQSSDNWLKVNGEIVTKDNLDSYIPELKLDGKDTNTILNKIIAIDKARGSWQEYFSVLESQGHGAIVKLIKNTDDLSKLTGDDIVQANKKAREAALAHNAALKQQTLGAKAAAVGMKALSMAANMAAMWAITKGIELATEVIDEAIVTNEEYLEQQDEIISKAEETISATESRISALEGLQEKIEATNGVQSEMLKLSEDINTVLGEGSDKILKQAGAYEVLYAQLEREMELEKKRQDEANQEKRKASFEKSANMTVTNTSGIGSKEVTFEEVMGKTGIHQTSKYDGTTTRKVSEVYYLSDYIDKYALSPDGSTVFSPEDLVDVYSKAISEYNSMFDKYTETSSRIKISDKELKNGIKDALDNLYVAFEDIINNGEGFLGANDKKTLYLRCFY